MTQDKQNKSDLGDQVLGKVAKVGIASQLTEAEQIDVDIQTNPLKVVQGTIESVQIRGEGVVMKQDLRMEAVKVSTGAVAINPLSAALGKIELTQPTDADAHVILAEVDINRALASDYLQPKMKNLQVQVEGQSATLDIQQAQLHLSEDGKITLDAQTYIHETETTQPLTLIGIPSIEDEGQRIALADVTSPEGQAPPPELVTTLSEIVTQLLDLRNFELGGIELQLKGMKVQAGELLLRAGAKVEQFPQ